MKHITIDQVKRVIERNEKIGKVIEGHHTEEVKKMWAEGNTPKFHPYYEIICDNS